MFFIIAIEHGNCKGNVFGRYGLNGPFFWYWYCLLLTFTCDPCIFCSTQESINVLLGGFQYLFSSLLFVSFPRGPTFSSLGGLHMHTRPLSSLYSAASLHTLWTMLPASTTASSLTHIMASTHIYYLGIYSTLVLSYVSNTRNAR